MPTFASLQKRQSELIRKALDGSIFVAPYTAPPVSAITDASGMLALPTGYNDVGWIDKGDGATWTADTDAAETTSWGSATPNRRDLNTKTTGLQFTMQETKRATLELYHGMDLSGVTPSTTTGEVTFDEPSSPAPRYLRVLAIAKDGAGADAIYIARWLPRASVTDVAEVTFKDDEEIRYGVTLTAYNDATAGTAVRYFFGGPGWMALTGTKHGFA